MLRYKVAGLLACATVFAGIVVEGCESPPVDEVIRCRAATPTVRDSLRLLCPSGGETFHVGDKVEIKWSYPTGWSNNIMVIDLYVEGGLKGCPDIPGGPIAVTDSASTDSWFWEIPSTIVRRFPAEVRDTVHLAGQTECFIQVHVFDTWDFTQQPTTYFSIAE